MDAPFLRTAKCRWASCPTSSSAVRPTEPIVCPASTFVPGGDDGCGGQILIVRDAAVVVPDDDRRAEQLVVIDRRDRAVCRGPYRRALGGGQVDAVMRAPVARRGVEGQLLHAVRALRLAGHRPHADVRRLRVDLLVGLRDGRGFRRLSDGGRLALQTAAWAFSPAGTGSPSPWRPTSPVRSARFSPAIAPDRNSQPDTPTAQMQSASTM